MSTQKEKQNSKRNIIRSIMRRRTLLASQNVLFIDEVNKMLYPFDGFPLEAELPVMNLNKFSFEPNAKEVAQTQIKAKKMTYILATVGVLVALTAVSFLHRNI